MSNFKYQHHMLQACTMDWQTSRKIDYQKPDGNNVVSSVLPIALLQWLLSNQEWTSPTWMQQFTTIGLQEPRRLFIIAFGAIRNSENACSMAVFSC